MQIGEEQTAVEVPIPVHPDDLPVTEPGSRPAEPAETPAPAPVEVPA